MLVAGITHAQPAACNGPSFNSPPSFDTGPNPNSVTAGDVNGDGFQDLVVANLTSGTVSVLLGDGAGAFLPPVSYEVGIESNAGVYARDAAIGDLNSDGKPDLVVVGGYNRGWVSVLVGDGSGNFGQAVNHSTGNATLESVVLGDFNGDNKKDVAAAATDSNRILFLLGDGTGGLAPSLQAAVPAHANKIATGDLNGDGLSDVVVTHTYPTWGFSAVLGHTTGNFAISQSTTTRSQPKSIVLADFNEDSKLDVAISFGWADHGIEYRFGDGAGNFGSSTEMLTVFEGVSLISADVNKDNNVDLIVHLSSASAVEVFLGNGNGGFTRTRSYGTLPDDSLAMASADFNQDGNPDVVAINVRARAVAVLLGDGLGGFASPDVMVRNDAQGSRLVAADFNGDSRPDIAMTRHFANQVLIYLADATGRLQPPTLYPTNRPGRSIATGDFNHDGKADLALGDNLGAVSILLGNGLGGFSGPTVFNVKLVNIPLVVTVVGKFDGDNHEDLIVLQEGSFSGSGAYLLRGDGAGNFGAASAISSGDRPSWLASADFNGDGRLDLAIANPFPAQIAILHGDGTGTFTLANPQFPLSRRASFLLAADLNKDGRPDLVMANNDSAPGHLAVMLNTGSGFGPVVTIEDASLAPIYITAADFNADSNLDLAISTHSNLGNIAVMSGDGQGNLGSLNYFTAGGTAGELAIADLNSDAKPDVISSNYAGVLLNTFTPLPCLSINDVSVTENDSGSVTAEFTVTLSAVSADTVRVNYETSGVTASKSLDFTHVSGRLSFAPGETVKKISVPVVADLLDEFDETVKVKLSNPAKAGIIDQEGMLTIIDNDPIPTLHIADSTAVEGGFSARSLTVTLSAPSGKTVTVQYATASGTATSGVDYANTSGTATIQAGQTSVTFLVQVLGEAKFEPDETFVVNLSNPVNATIEDGQAVVTLINDDPMPSVSVFGGAVQEGNSGTVSAVVTVTLSNPSYLPVSFNFTTADQTATAGADYVPLSGSVTIDPDQTSGSFTVTVNGDTVDEIDEIVLVNTSNLQNATTITASASLFIVDDDGPTISISDTSVTEGNSGTSSATFTLTLSAASPQTISVRIRTASGTALQGNDFVGLNGIVVSVQAGTNSRTVSVPVNGDTVVEPDETFVLNLSDPARATIADSQGVATIVNDDSEIQLSSAASSSSEADGSVAITVTRNGNTSTAATVGYATSDTASLTECTVTNGVASSRCDYATSIGTVNFAAGEASKNIFIPIVNDGYAEGNETFSITLSHPVGATLGSFTTATVTIQDNESVNGANPLDQVDFFIEQHYMDFLGRNAEPAGLAGWRNVLNNCGTTVAEPCDRIEVSAGFFRSPEFQSRGYFIYRFYSSVGAIPLYDQFMPDFAKVSGFLSDAQLEANKVAFVNEFMARSVFQNKYSSTFGNPTAYVDSLLATVGLPGHPSRQTWINQLTASNTTDTRGQVLRALVESQQVYDKYYNEAFVIMQYFGYLRRTADASYLDWINTMNQTGGDYRIMINGFLNSAEYRRRFGP